MKKIFSYMGIMILAGTLLTGCSMGPEQMKSVPIEDTAKIETLHNITKEAMATYFDVDVNDGVDRTLEGFESYVLVDLPSETYLHRNNVIKTTAKGDPVEGELYSYGASLDPETNEITGAIIVNYSKAEPQEYTTEQLEEIAMTFIRDKQIVENPDALVFEGIEKGMSSEQYTGLRFKDGEDDVLISISLQTGKVSHFEYVKLIETPESAK